MYLLHVTILLLLLGGRCGVTITAPLAVSVDKSVLEFPTWSGVHQDQKTFSKNQLNIQNYWFFWYYSGREFYNWIYSTRNKYINIHWMILSPSLEIQPTNNYISFPPQMMVKWNMLRSSWQKQLKSNKKFDYILHTRIIRNDLKLSLFSEFSQHLRP